MKYRIQRTDRANDQLYRLIQYIADDTGDIDFALQYVINMVRGTTPPLSFHLPFDTASIRVLYITFEQCGTIILEKDISDCSLDGQDITVTLSQAETLLMYEDHPMRIQIRIKDADGNASASNVIITTVQEILKDGEI